MTALNKQALREAVQEEIMLRSVSDTSDAWQDEASPEAVLALLDENLQLQRDKDSLEAVAIAVRDDMRDAREKLKSSENDLIDSECHVAELEESLRDNQALLEAAEKRIAEQREYYEGVIADGSRRIAELEARTVMLPEPFNIAKSSSGLTYYYADEVDAAIQSAGIGVKVE